MGDGLVDDDLPLRLKVFRRCVAQFGYREKKEESQGAVRVFYHEGTKRRVPVVAKNEQSTIPRSAVRSFRKKARLTLAEGAVTHEAFYQQAKGR